MISKKVIFLLGFILFLSACGGGGGGGGGDSTSIVSSQVNNEEITVFLANSLGATLVAEVSIYGPAGQLVEVKTIDFSTQETTFKVPLNTVLIIKDKSTQETLAQTTIDDTVVTSIKELTITIDNKSKEDAQSVQDACLDGSSDVLEVKPENEWGDDTSSATRDACSKIVTVKLLSATSTETENKTSDNEASDIINNPNISYFENKTLDAVLNNMTCKAIHTATSAFSKVQGIDAIKSIQEWEEAGMSSANPLDEYVPPNPYIRNVRISHRMYSDDAFQPFLYAYPYESGRGPIIKNVSSEVKEIEVQMVIKFKDQAKQTTVEEINALIRDFETKLNTSGKKYFHLSKEVGNDSWQNVSTLFSIKPLVDEDFVDLSQEDPVQYNIQGHHIVARVLLQFNGTLESNSLYALHIRIDGMENDYWTSFYTCNCNPLETFQGTSYHEKKVTQFPLYIFRLDLKQYVEHLKNNYGIEFDSTPGWKKVMTQKSMTLTELIDSNTYFPSGSEFEEEFEYSLHDDEKTIVFDDTTNTYRESTDAETDTTFNAVKANRNYRRYLYFVTSYPFYMTQITPDKFGVPLARQGFSLTQTAIKFFDIGRLGPSTSPKSSSIFFLSEQPGIGENLSGKSFKLYHRIPLSKFSGASKIPEAVLSSKMKLDGKKLTHNDLKDLPYIIEYPLEFVGQRSEDPDDNDKKITTPSGGILCERLRWTSAGWREEELNLPCIREGVLPPLNVSFGSGGSLQKEAPVYLLPTMVSKLNNVTPEERSDFYHHLVGPMLAGISSHWTFQALIDRVDKANLPPKTPTSDDRKILVDMLFFSEEDVPQFKGFNQSMPSGDLFISYVAGYALVDKEENKRFWAAMTTVHSKYLEIIESSLSDNFPGIREVLLETVFAYERYLSLPSVEQNVVAKAIKDFRSSLQNGFQQREAQIREEVAGLGDTYQDEIKVQKLLMEQTANTLASTVIDGFTAGLDHIMDPRFALNESFRTRENPLLSDQEKNTMEATKTMESINGLMVILSGVGLLKSSAKLTANLARSRAIRAEVDAAAPLFSRKVSSEAPIGPPSESLSVNKRLNIYNKTEEMAQAARSKFILDDSTEAIVAPSSDPEQITYVSKRMGKVDEVVIRKIKSRQAGRLAVLDPMPSHLAAKHMGNMEVEYTGLQKGLKGNWTVKGVTDKSITVARRPIKRHLLEEAQSTRRTLKTQDPLQCGEFKVDDFFEEEVSFTFRRERFDTEFKVVSIKETPKVPSASPKMKVVEVKPGIIYQKPAEISVALDDAHLESWFNITLKRGNTPFTAKFAYRSGDSLSFRTPTNQIKIYPISELSEVTLIGEARALTGADQIPFEVSQFFANAQAGERFTAISQSGKSYLCELLNYDEGLGIADVTYLSDGKPKTMILKLKKIKEIARPTQLSAPQLEEITMHNLAKLKSPEFPEATRSLTIFGGQDVPVAVFIEKETGKIAGFGSRKNYFDNPLLQEVTFSVNDKMKITRYGGFRRIESPEINDLLVETMNLYNGGN